MTSVKDVGQAALVSAQHGHKGRVSDNMAAVVYEKREGGRPSRPAWGIPILGLTLALLGVVLFMAEPAQQVHKLVRRFNEGSYMFNKWLNPPVKVNLNFYLFNYTNAEAFMRGEEKLEIQELGPYSYQEIPGARNVTFNANGTMTYIPTRELKDDPGVTVGDATKDIIVVPNFVFLGLASYLAESSLFTNMAFNVFTRMVKSEPFLTMTVDEYLRGYDEPLLSYASKIVPGMVPMSKIGFIDTIVFDGENVVTMNLNQRRVTTPEGETLQPFSLDQYNGSPGLRHWGYEEDDNSTHFPCNTLRGVASEGVFIPRPLTEDVRILHYRKAFCRTMTIILDRKGYTSKGVPAYWLKFSKDNFHNSAEDNQCYCSAEPCLPDGLTDISPCLINMPLAISAPHFLWGDPELLRPWPALRPSPEKHDTVGLLDETFGVLVHAKLRIQLNLVVRHNRFNPLASPFGGLVLPAMWAEYHFNEIPDGLHTLLYLSVVVLPKLCQVISALLTLVGVFLFMKGFFKPIGAKAVYKRLFMYSRPAIGRPVHT